MDILLNKYWIVCSLCILVTYLSFTNAAGHFTNYEQVFPFNFVSPGSVTYSCPSGWTMRGTHCYKVYSAMLPHDQASMACRHQGGMLADIRDMGDNLFLGELVESHSDTIMFYWSGWRSNNNDHFTYWGPRQPADDYDCAKIMNAGLYPWIKHDCGDALAFVCQSTACLSNEFKCRSGMCIKQSYANDGENDCGDWSDEWSSSSSCEMSYIELTSSSSSRTVATSSTYPDSSACSFLIEGPVGHRLELEFTLISTEENHDIISVYYGSPVPNDADFAGHFSGVYTSLPRKIVSTNNFLLVTFDTDNTNAGISQRRFRATARVEASSTVLPTALEATVAPQTVDSPDYTSDGYPTNTHASWIISAPNEFDVITVVIEDLKLNSEDSVTVYHGSEADDAQHFITFNGPIDMEGTMDYFTSTTSSLFIMMRTRSVDGAKGFRFSYKLGCDMDFTLTFAKIHTPGQYSALSDDVDIDITNHNYPILRSCMYTVETPVLNVTANTLTPFVIRSLNNVGLGSGDTLAFEGDFDGDGNTDSPDMSIFNGNSVTQSITDGRLKVKFSSDISTNSNGLRAAYSKGCPDPDTPYENTQIIGTYSSDYGASFQVQCPTGEFFAEAEFSDTNNPVSIECLFGGQWNVLRLPTCTEVYCGKIPSVDNARVALDGNDVTTFTGAQAGDIVTYECLPGSSRLGSVSSLTIQCEDSGSWAPEPTCSRGTCGGTLTNPSNGVLTVAAGTFSNVGTVIEVECNPGYEQTRGLPFLLCQEGGSWNGALADVRCEPLTCLAPSVPHSSSSPDTVTIDFGSSVTIVCESGYIIEGTADSPSTSQTINCVLNDDETAVELSMGAQQCVNRNECEDTTDNCNLVADIATCEDTEGSFECVCITGYELDNAGTTCVDINECNEDTDGCYDGVQYCNNESPAAEGDARYTCSCPVGFEIYTQPGQNGFGATVQFGEDCVENPGDARVIGHSCIRSACPDPRASDIGNGAWLAHPNKQYFYTGESLTLFCDLGYVIGGGTAGMLEQTFTCNSGASGQPGTWSTDPFPTCQPAKCQSVTDQGLLTGKVVPPARYSSEYSATDEVDFYDASSATVGVVTAICEPPEANAAVERKLYCLFDYTDDTYKLMGDSLECADTRVDCGTPNVPGLSDAARNTQPTFKGATFTFSCDDANAPQGSSSVGAGTVTTTDDTTVECLDTGIWDYGTLKCNAQTCGDPGRPHGGTQTAVSYEQGQVVTFSCYEDGFEPDVTALICQQVGSSTTFDWFEYNVDTLVVGSQFTAERPVCEDKEFPVWDVYCEDGLTFWVDKYKYISNYAFSDTVLTPGVTDNKGIQSLTFTTIPAFELTAPVVNDVQITWTASDFQSNTNSCVIDIKVKREELPTLPCTTGYVTVTLNEEAETIIVNENSLRDDNVLSEAPTESGFVPVHQLEPTSISLTVADLYDVHIVKWTAFYRFGEEVGPKAECPISVQLVPNQCTRWAFERLVPDHATVAFNDAETEATVTCDPSYTFHSQTNSENELSELVYQCNGGSSYMTTTSGFGSYVPACVLAGRANFDHNFGVEYGPGAFTGGVFDAYVNDIDSRLGSAGNQIKAQILQCNVATLNIVVSRVGTPTVADSGTTLKVVYKITYTDTAPTLTTDLTNCRIAAGSFFTENFGNTNWILQTLNPAGQQPVTGIYDSDAADTADYSCADDSKIQLVAGTGSIRVENCVPCPPGYKISTTAGVHCDRCPEGTYQDEAGQTDCKPCPDGEGTYETGAVSTAQCYAHCASPTVSEAGNSMFPCEPCTANHYREDANTCTICPTINGVGRRTRGPVGAASEAGCLDRCAEGSFSYDGYGLGTSDCRECPLGHYSSTPGSSSCSQCSSGQTTLAMGADESSDCTADGCASLTCGDHGTCTVSNARQLYCACNAGYTGSACETNIDDCAHDPCFYNGQCVDLVNGYRCDNCPLAFDMETEIGGRSVDGPPPLQIQQNTDETACKAACLAVTACQFVVVSATTCTLYNQPLSEYTQTINSAFTIFEKQSTLPVGDCTGEPDNCEGATYDADPCRNGGMCQDGVESYSCLCPIAGIYGGDRCNNEQSPCVGETCSGHGTCEVVPAGGSNQPIYKYCVCNAGWTGVDCELDIDECAADPCFYDVDCTNNENVPNSYSCDCLVNDIGQRPFTGTNCQFRSGSVNVCAGQCSSCVQDYRNNEPMCLCEDGQTTGTYYTVWFNADDANSDSPTANQATGDYETIAEHQRVYGTSAVCNGNDIVVMSECRVVNGNGVLYRDMPANDQQNLEDDYACNNEGLWCKDEENGGACLDYEVRYQCQARLGGCSDTNQCEEPVSITGRTLQCTSDIDGSCSDNGYGITCPCDEGYEGYFCEDDVDDCVQGGNPVCLNGATCTDALNDYTCACADGYEGDNCEINTDECSTSPCLFGTTCTNGPCVHGTCNDEIDAYTCQCDTGYTGEHCETDIDDCEVNPCRNGGACTDNPPTEASMFTCTCGDGWLGTLCETLNTTCQEDTCQNNGPCFNVVNTDPDNGFYCSCAPGSTGVRCDPGQNICDVADPCANNGVCSVVNGEPECACPPAYAGLWCERTRDFCSDDNNVCENGGTCTIRDDLSAGYSCECADGFTGTECQIDINECSSENCGSGQCIDSANEAFCICPFGRVGYGCAKLIYRQHDLCLDDEPVQLLHSFAMGSQHMSVSAWVKYNTVGESATFLQLLTAESQTNAEPDDVLVSFSEAGVRVNVRGGSSLQPLTFADLPFNINDGQWHHVAVTYDKMTHKLFAYVDDITTTDAAGSNALAQHTTTNFTDFATLVLGSDSFTGCVSLAQVWGSALAHSDITDIFVAKGNDVTNQLQDGLLQDWGWGIYSTSAGVSRLTGSMRGLPVCDLGETLNQQAVPAECEQVMDKTRPTVGAGCPTMDEVAMLDPLDPTNPFTVPVVIDSDDFFEEEEDEDEVEIGEFNYDAEHRFSVGRHQVVYNAYDNAGNRATCSYNIFVRFGDCLDKIPASSSVLTCAGTANDLYRSCDFNCNAGTGIAVDNPQTLTCGPSGILDYDNPYLSRRVPTCTATNTNVRNDLVMTWDYVIGSGNALTSSQLIVMETTIRDGLESINGFCDSNDCTNQVEIDFVQESNNRGVLKVTATATGIMLELSGNDVEKLLYAAIVQGNSFDETSIGSGVEVQEDTYRLSMTLTCDANFQQPWVPNGSDDPVCANCGAGTYYDDTTDMCTFCPVGEYQSAEAQDSCTACPDDETTETIGSIAIGDCFESCPAGEFYNADLASPECDECPLGKYQPNAGANYCIQCPFGFTTQVTGATQLSDCIALCDAGFELDSDNNCVECDKGFFRVTGSIEGCQPCPDDDYTTLYTASTSDSACSVRLCDAGEFAEYPDGADPFCTPCPQHEYKEGRDNATECVMCPDGFRTDGEGRNMSSDCKFFCEEGEFIVEDPNNIDTPQSCEPCPKDTRKGDTDYYERSCFPCNDDGMNATAGTGSTSEADCIYEMCGPGQEIGEGETTCSACAFDTYQPLHNPIAEVDLCMPCPDGTGTELKGTATLSECMVFCPSGQELDSINNVCVECPIGQFKDNTISAANRFTQCVNCTDSNYVTPSTGSESNSECTVRDCGPGEYINGANCLPCPVGQYNGERWQASCTLCPTGTSTDGTGKTTVAECNVYDGTQPFVASPVRYDVPFADADEQFRIDVRESITLFFRYDASTNPDGLQLFRAANVLAATWNTDIGTSRTEVVLQILIDSTNFPATQWTATYNSTIDGVNGEIRQRLSEYITAQRGAAELAITNDFTPVVSIQPDTLCTSGESRSGGVCVPCEVGHYQTDETAEVCIPCLPGYSTASTGQTLASACIFECGPGEEANDDNDACVACEEDSIKAPDASPVSGCTRCTTNQHGNSNRTICYANSVAGEFSTASGPMPCPLGTYSTMVNVEACTECPAGKSTINNGSTSVDMCKLECPEGEEFNADNTGCEACDADSIKTPTVRAVMPCTSCGSGRHANGTRTVCLVDSSPGSYSTQNGAVECAVGSFTELPNQESCTRCPGSESTRSAGSANASDCTSLCILNQHTCQNNGTCRPTNDAQLVCDCPATAQGDRCQVVISEPDPNINNGQPTKRFAFPIIFLNDFFAVVASDSARLDFIRLVVQTVMNFLSNVASLPRSIVSVEVAGLASGSTVASLELLADANGLTDPQDVQAFIDALNVAIDQYVAAFANNDSLPTDQTQQASAMATSDFPGGEPCSGGNKYDEANDMCVPCAMGEYQPTSETTVCRTCSGDLTTRATGATALDQCISPCAVQGDAYCNDRGKCVTSSENEVSCDCDDNYIGSRCNIREDPEDGQQRNLIIGLSVGGGILLLLVCFIIACLVYNRRSTPPKPKVEMGTEYPQAAPSVMGYYPTTPMAAYPTAYTSTYGSGQNFATPLQILPAQSSQDNYMFYDDQAGGAYTNNSFY